MKQLFFCLSIALFLVGCKKNEVKSQQSANAEITQQVNKLYSMYGKSNDAIYDQPIPENLFSPELKKTLENAIDASKTDIEKVKKSAHPEDKPMILEGSTFSSLYEGYTSYKIKSIDTVKDNTAADVTVEFEFANAKIPPKTSWTDKVHLINSNNGWRIDNVIFSDKNKYGKDVKTNLNKFTTFTKENTIK